VTPPTTERLILRKLTLDDLDDLTAMFADEAVMRYIGAGGVLGRDAAERVVERELRTTPSAAGASGPRSSARADA
jgi:RimJ/RimL family protein N-acetyltransferase